MTEATSEEEEDEEAKDRSRVEGEERFWVPTAQGGKARRGCTPAFVLAGKKKTVGEQTGHSSTRDTVGMYLRLCGSFSDRPRCPQTPPGLHFYRFLAIFDSEARLIVRRLEKLSK